MWDILDTDFGGDETANFGPRKETGTALYQIDTIATVSCSDQLNTKVPQVSSSVLGDLTSLTVDTSLIVQSTSVIGLDQVIDDVEWSPDGSLIIVGVSEGILYVIDAESTESLFSYALVPEERRVDGKSFRRILFSGIADLVVLTADGQIVVQSGIEIFKQEGADIQDVVKDKIKIIETQPQHIVTHDIVLFGNFIYTLGGGESILSKWNYSGAEIKLEDEVESILENDAELLHGRVTTDGHYLFALDSNNHVSLWDTNTLVCIRHWNDMKVADLCLLETNTSQNNSLQDMKLVVLTVPEGGVCDLKVQSLPSWETVYNLQLNASSMLAKCNTFQDALYLTEFCAADQQPGTVSTVRFRCLNETDPKTRLYRILQKNRFEEAEKFAKMFQLDIELVHKVKTNYLINELSPWNVGKYSEEQVKEMTDQLWVCLDTIVDDLHTAESCIRAALPTFAATQALLTYCKNRLDKIEVSSKDPTVKDKCHVLMTKYLETQHRLVTFKMTYGEDNFSGEIWEQFMRADLLEESLAWMDRGYLNTGFILWARHQAEWTSDDQLSKDVIQKILSTIPYDIQPTILQGHLSVGLIPTVVREVPEALELVVNFIIEKTQNMELIDKKNWPGSAVRFAQFLYTRLRDMTEVVIDQDTCMAQDSANKTRLQYEVVLQPLHTLIIKLQQLDDLLHKYKFRLSLSQFLQETRETIAFRMLDRVVALELIMSTLERQIRPYMKEHGLNQDEIFSKYIKDLLQRSSQIRSYTTGETSWEAKAVAIIGFINDLEQKIQGILEVMEWAPIPWSPGINDLIQKGLKLKHPRVSKLKEQCDRVHVRKLMLKHGLKNAEVPQGDDAEHLMYYVLTQDKPGCMEDAIEIMKSCHVKTKSGLYTFRLRQLIATDRIEEAVELLRSLPADLGEKVASELLNYAIVKLDYTVDIPGAEDKINRDKELFTEASIYITRYLETQVQDPLEVQDLRLKENILTHLLALQVEYELYLTTDQYQDEDHKMSVIYSYLIDFFKRRKQCPSLSYAKVYRLADILQISHTKIQGQLAIESASNGDIQKAVEICGELYESDPSEETAATLYEVAQSFLFLQANVDTDDVDTNKLRLLPDLCYRLANQATAICSSDKLCQYLELSKTCSLLLTASQQCESGDTTLSSEWGERGENTTYSPEKAQEMFGAVSLDIFKEDALLMNSTVVLPLVSKYATINPLLDWPEEDDSPGKDSDKIQSLCNRVLPVVRHLRENSHQHLAYLFSVHMLDTLTQYIQQQDMGLPIYSEELSVKLEQDKKKVQGLHQTSQSLLKELVAGVVMKIFNCSKVDVNLALTFLCTRPKREVLDIMMKLTKAAGYQYKRLKYVAAVGIALGQLLKEPTLIDNCQMLETDASWGYRLSKMKIPFQDVFLGPTSSKRKVLPAIAQSDTADCELVKEFCQSFSLDEDEGLLLYLDHLFVPPDDAVYVNKSNRAALISKAKTSVEQITNKDELLTRLKKLYYRTSSYDYETLEFILEVMQDLDDIEDIPLEKGLKLLEYLKVYTRHSEPSEYEMDYKPGGDKKELQIVMSCLPPESKTRLPIHPLLQGDTWKIITPELKRETVDTWLRIAKLLCLSDDQICLTTVQNMVRLYSETFLTPDAGSDMSLWNWSSESANHILLKEASEVLQLVKNCENSLACAKWMVTKLPMGSEKVLVLKECIRLAELWHQSIPEESAKREKAKAAYLKFLKHWQKMASAQVLCQHGLGDAELLQMTDKPALLIQKLYEHPSITDMDWDSVKKKPGIHEAAEGIAAINKIDLTLVQTGLIQKWLQSSNNHQADSDTTMTFNLENLKLTEEVVTGNKTDDEEQNFKRLVHLLKRGKVEEKMILLIEFAFKPSENQDMMGSIRALRCLLHLYDDEMLRQQCNKSMEDLRQLMHIMIYLVNLEKLHIKHTVQTFITCQKEALVKGIWKNHSHEKTAVTLVSCLCLDFDLYDKQLWTSILQKLYQFGLMKQLEYVLCRLCNVPELWAIPSFSKMWQTVIMGPLNKVCSPLSPDQIDVCVHYFNLMLSCPVLKELDLDVLSKAFMRLDLSSCAVGCLLMAVTPQEDKIKSLVEGNFGVVLENTSKLLPHGLNHGIAVKVQEALHQLILDTESFKEVLGTNHQTEFVSYCVKRKCVDGLLQFAVKNQRLSEAEALIDMYISRHADVLMKLEPYMDDDDDDGNGRQLAQLKAYLKMQKLEDILKHL